ncbi:2-dehydro-3-deoxygalactonokinase [Alsobacter sp. SYSU M60028]|uniref:2-dehydro-3-deoxygalactonokinase n=1 Tax=Alsobacter ponti TaxID=2962936 RepID=A0ABT1L9G3_9HYPH|nr:2-dehydro-3-deoxygalactonokinase [Alsobacter ponti]MCP8938129.1 2-dehydro-3-deoxygalactonokinase [Alsobacter ponti]
MSAPKLIAVDWGTTRLRAWLVDADGGVLARAGADEGIMAVPPGGFPAALRRQVGPWLGAHPGLPVAMAGMVGSRNGWVEAPYVECPTTVAGIAAKLARVDLGDGVEGLIVPGLAARDSSGAPDVMRGEETKLAGCDVTDGAVVMPGTHAKWARVGDGEIRGFSTFMTGDFYAALTEHTILGKLAEEPEDEAGFLRGVQASRRPGGLTHQAFSARTLVLMGEMPGAQVKPYVSGLLIGGEVAQGLAMSDDKGGVTVVADGPLGRFYELALAEHGRECRLLAPEDVFVRGLLRILDAA